MTKPMYCPMAFANIRLTEPQYNQYQTYVEYVKHWMECTPDCAWAVRDKEKTGYCCAVAIDAVKGTSNPVMSANARSLKDDAE